MKKSLILLLAPLLAISAPLTEPSTPPAEKTQFLLGAQTVARTAPPHGPMNLLVGEKIKDVPKGTELTVLGKKTYGGFSGSHVWLEVEPSVQAPSSVKEKYWVYGGVQNAVNVVPSRVVPTK